ncbi:helix-turn-helix domain-containing protein [Yimella sp. cx-51]|uniref:winged helix-turn-helix domain-containing protein n=1 Tax=Yimella sp. cx-51 TaxID=2770551 RepID=UPI00165DB2B9|nr:helix-turn-helix domain-containing protein [Yimella sp. cx-51]MBC9958359.1 helix-turn-helix transcriptional regulator [Yimella sp. cx-51]QTH39742.1 helix-turn-helix transcriptional regulator [Yimella sp. cx-51]
MDEARLRQFYALSDPVRLALVETLRLAGGPMTSAVLTRAVPDAGGGLSFQLETLEDAGLVERGSGRGRATQWTAKEIPLSWDEDDERDPQGAIAIRSFERELTERREVRFRRWLSEKRTTAWDPQWSHIDDSYEWVLELTPGQVADLHADLAAVVARHREASSEEKSSTTSSAERVFVALTTCPVRISQ